jgi:transcriptional regulator with XRE-family HTH domain
VDNPTFGSFLLKVRKRTGKRQREIAAELKVTTGHISHVENEKANLVRSGSSIARAYGMTPAEQGFTELVSMIKKGDDHFNYDGIRAILLTMPENDRKEAIEILNGLGARRIVKAAMMSYP